MSATERGLRRFLLAAAAATYVGAAAELAILEHWAEWRQWIAFVFVVAGLAAVAWAWRGPTARALTALRGTGLVAAIGGGVGAALHAWGNAQFAWEIDPSLGAAELAVEAVTGGYPLLAPGMLALAAALGVAAAWRHPAEAR